MATSIPPIRPHNFLPVLIMVMLWVGLRSFDVPENQSFVIACVVAQAYLIWRNLPQVAQNLRDVDSTKPRMLFWPVAAVIFFAALQLWLSSPLFTQRILTIFSLFFLIVMIIGIRREHAVMERIEPAVKRKGPSMVAISLLRVNAIIAVVVIVVNEILIAFETLVVWISAMPILALLLHVLYWSLVLFVVPDEEEGDAA